MWEESSTLNWGPGLVSNDESMADDTELRSTDTMYRKTSERQATYRTPKGVEKQLGCTLVDRKHMSCRGDAEANDVIHVGSDHRSAMAQFVIIAAKKEVSQKKHTAKRSTSQQQRAQRVKTMEK